jgi:hypothetical protein
MRSLFKLTIAVVAFFTGAIALIYLAMLLAERPRMNFQKNLKARATAQELHAWATGILRPYETNRDPSLWIEITNLPAAFHGLFKLAPSAHIYADSQGRFGAPEPVAYVMVTYGSAAGYFGVILGPTNLHTPPIREHEIRYNVWAPGAWFFDGQ